MKRFLFLFGAIGALGCGGSTEPTSIYGTYTLQTINGTTPPVPLWTDAFGETATIKSGKIELRGDGTYTITRGMHFTGCVSCGPTGTDETDTEDGTYSQAGNDLTLTYRTCCNVHTYAATSSGSRITLTVPSEFTGEITAIYVFTR